MPGSAMTPADATSALLRACAAGRPRRDLIDHWLVMGANLNATLDNGKTPLMLAAEAGDETMTDFLLSRGAAVNQQNPATGQTALMLAAWGGHAEAAVCLYRAGALADVTDTSGKSAHSHAQAPRARGATGGRPSTAARHRPSGPLAKIAQNGAQSPAAAPLSKFLPTLAALGYTERQGLISRGDRHHDRYAALRRPLWFAAGLFAVAHHGTAHQVPKHAHAGRRP